MSPQPLLILLVEDNPDDIELTRRSLAKSRIAHRLVVLEESDRALALAESGAEQPALILLDLNLPGLPGRELLRRFRAQARWAATPIVVLSTSAQPTDVDDSYRGGANAYHVKPDDFHRYEQTVQEIARYWLTLAAPPSSRSPLACGERCRL